MNAASRVGAIALVAACVSGCAGALLEVSPDRGAPASPRDYWRPDPDGVDGARPLTGTEEKTYVSPEETEDLSSPGAPLGLERLIDVALLNNPETHATWSAARAQAAAVGAARGAYYPQIDMTAEYLFSQGIAASGSEAYTQRDYGPEWTLSWLLFDFGGREATIEAALQTLVAANWQHDQTVLDTILTVVQAYYDLVGATRQVEASELSVADSRESVRAAHARMEARIATSYDYLQAETTLAEIQIDLETYRGQVEIARGQLATAIGLPANVSLDVASGDFQPDVSRDMGSVDEMIDVARRLRPDLARAWAELRASEAEVWVATAAMLPSFSATGQVQRLTVEADQTTERGWPYTTGLTVTLPIFTGLTNLNTLREARANAETARADAVSAEQAAIEDVWSSYANLRTAQAQVKTSRRWLEAARESYKAARVAYDNGLGNIIALLDAQIALASARSQVISADTSWFTTLAQLAHDVGLFSRDAAVHHLQEELGAPALLRDVSRTSDDSGD